MVKTVLGAPGDGVPSSETPSGVFNSASMEKSLLPKEEFAARIAMTLVPPLRNAPALLKTISSHAASWLFPPVL